MNELPIENIKTVHWDDGKIYVVYKDGTKLVAAANETKLVADYKNNNDIPLNDHCL